ncbi:MAG: Asp-tRNA(Asn)/Glu-tRNA(Gln) amidotransferase subunit GatC [Deltaproteobacteria bacterium]|nr:Asp-tRNA(Asn)/Glu-tRNA(Gln) amidotransferase subunit GatC [Deltaproteobacteria bacterium]MBW2018763.1 Asp-tRNA(Asn)/Glu-tRNA(Gln) amidotransferase subunit GatC [Deltaproteobacteria bacterium]MBW2073492.1 Asp-tRNA(Asn)/Glu-tRNA(Gln) amidotransferase subunit GatC [Deltaproteobacteria bacterium]RLB83004.1 MAG: Asp-tRNA(Asn)/Glu-tRNA(Gln) amidotransferase subunit GatB [Deltaproteobacteria bacterium]
MKITKEEVVHVAKLARLNLDEDAIALYTKQLGDILTYMEALNRVDTEDVRPTSHAIFINNAFREDEVKPSMPVERALANAPESEDGGFIVPKVIG